MITNSNDLQNRLWSTADELRANSSLKSSEYSVPVLGLIFLRYADYKFRHAQQQLEAETATSQRRRRTVGKLDYQARGVLYLPEVARFHYLLNLPESANLGQAINAAMKAIEEENLDLKGVLPHTYSGIENKTLVELLKLIGGITGNGGGNSNGEADGGGDVFGLIYEYFLGKFAMSEGQKGGEFFTPTSLVRLIVEIIEPFHGRIFDPACGSGGMFVQSAAFVERHKRNPSSEISVYGQERVEETIRLCKMNLAVHGLAGDIKQGNAYYEDLHQSTGRFDFVMANPPFNVDRVDKERIANDPRFPLGMPSSDNANYLWIQLFASALNPSGRAGFVMANSACDARASELTLRQKLIEQGVVDVMVAVGPNFFFTVTLPCTLWFLDKGKSGARRNTVLFIDARHIYRQIDRAHRQFATEQIEFLADIVRLYRGESVETLSVETFPDGVYRDVPGLCKAATLAEIEAQGWSLNPGRYVGVAARAKDEFVFAEKLEELNEELELLNIEAQGLEARIAENIAMLMEQVAT